MRSNNEDRRWSDAELHALYDERYVEQYDPHAVGRMARMRPLFDLAPTDVIADFGCGNGVLLEVIGADVRQYVGVDFSQAFVQDAERRRDALGIRNGAFVCEEIVAFCERHLNAFDAGFALDFSEHIYDDQFLSIFSAIHRSLKPGAVLYLHTPNREYFMERLRASRMLAQIEGHVAVRDVRAHLDLLRQCGFNQVRVHYLPHYLFPASALHGLGALPLVGPWFRARLLLACRKESG